MTEPLAPTELLPRFDPAELRGFERVAVPLLTRWNRSPLAKRLVYGFVRYVSHPWIQAAIGNRLLESGVERVEGLRPPKGVLLVANHRTFWDMYVATSVLETHTDFIRSLYFPVRARFFYDHPVGVLVNGAVSGGSMWPPMFDGFGRQSMNLTGLQQCAHVLQTPGSLVGIHPEGTRSKGSDPLDFLKARGGIGRVLQACDPDVIVLPYFLAGLTNDFVTEVRRNFRKPGQRGRPITLSWGTPVRVGDMDLDKAPVVVARELLEGIHELGERAVSEAPDQV
jgi:1-acyl-sn-glycerol-3-phosphate acyltransferase